MAETDLDILDRLIATATAAGADAADAILVRGVSGSASVRLGALEDIERSEGSDLGLRVLIGKRQAIVSSSDQKPEALTQLVQRAIDMARVAPEDPYCGIADPGEIAGPDLPDLDLLDETELSPELLQELATTAEDAARAVPGITNSEGGSASCSHGAIALAASNGFRGAYRSSSFSISAVVLAGDESGMERDYEYTSAHHFADLEDAALIGERAGTRTVARLGARKVESAARPVVYAPRVSNSLLGHLAGAVSGRSVARGTSFLKDRMGESLFAEGISILDDPRRIRGLRSKPFDGEGLATGPLAIIENGVLASWVMDIAAARQLDLRSTGHASRGTSAPPSPGTTNLYMAAGEVTPEQLIGDIESGFYVTELIGMGVNGITGDYSRGASGFWIEQGEIAYPVSEVTIAGNLKEMFLNATPASDLEFRYGINAPTLRVDGMMVAGS
jgi:PmbA protein